MNLAEKYERCGRGAGYSVAEYEELLGLPPFSIYPRARKVDALTARGFFMYRSATPEERDAMNRSRTARARASKIRSTRS
jgi:hypothetical protein